MKLSPFFLTVLVALPWPPAWAQDTVVAPSPSSRTSLDVYAQPGAAQPLRQLPVSEAGLPLPIQAAQAGFYQVTLGGQAVWLARAQVRVKRGSSGGCTTASLAPRNGTAATPGLGQDACQ